MQQLFLFLLFVLAARHSFAQENNWLTTYYPSVNRAEMAIVANDYAGALWHYQTAFAAVPNGFARDYHNAALCAIRSNNQPIAFEFFKKMMLKGMDESHFQDTIFAAVHYTHEWNLFRVSWTSLIWQYQVNSDQELLLELRDLAARDQEFRLKEGSYAVYRDTIRRIDSLNVLRFQQILAVKGFPSEDMIGTSFPRPAPYEIVLHHHAQHLSEPDKYAGWPDLAPDLISAAKNGHLEPARAAFWLALQNDPKYQLGAFGLIQFRIDGVLQPGYYLEKINRPDDVEEARRAMGLEPFQDYYDKCRYRIQHPDTPFRLNAATGVNIFDLDEITAQAVQKTCILIEPK